MRFCGCAAMPRTPRPARAHSAFLVGSETQNIERSSVLSGVQRVVRESHASIADTLGTHGASLVPVHTRGGQRTGAFRSNPYLASDDVLDLPPYSLSDIDVLMLLDLNTNVDFSAIFREKRKRSLPVVALVHDILPLIHPQWWVDDSHRVFRLCVQQVLAVADHIVVTSDKVRQDLVRLGWRHNAAIHVIGLGSPFRRQRPEPVEDGRLSMLYVSTVEPRKGHDILLDAFDMLVNDGVDVDLTLIGAEGWLSESLIARIRAHPEFQGRLRWLVNANDLAVATIARHCSIGVFPSADEGFGLFLEEGLSYGLKMVVSDIPVFRERATANVWFSKRTPEALANAIRRSHESDQIVDPVRTIRSMRDFGADLSDLLLQALGVAQTSK